MKEVWKDIAGYEGLYQISSFGRVKSFRQAKRLNGGEEYILNPTISNNGYEQITLYRSPTDRHKFLVHRLVAQTFIPNPDNLEAVNHKDENRLNNHADNLEWCTMAYNNAYGTATIRSSITKGQKIQQFTINGVLLATYESIHIASMITGIEKHTIKDCCSGSCQFGKGYIWRYVDTSAQ